MFKKLVDLIKTKVAYNKATNHPVYSKFMQASQKAIVDLGLDKLVKINFKNYESTKSPRR